MHSLKTKTRGQAEGVKIEEDGHDEKWLLQRDSWRFGDKGRDSRLRIGGMVDKRMSKMDRSKFMDVVKENVHDDRVGWRQMIDCGNHQRKQPNKEDISLFL